MARFPPMSHVAVRSLVHKLRRANGKSTATGRTARCSFAGRTAAECALHESAWEAYAALERVELQGISEPCNVVSNRKHHRRADGHRRLDRGPPASVRPHAPQEDRAQGEQLGAVQRRRRGRDSSSHGAPASTRSMATTTSNAASGSL
jgi:hypothetical protein